MRKIVVLIAVLATASLAAQSPAAPAPATPAPNAATTRPHKVMVADHIVTQSSATPVFGSVVSSSSQYNTAPAVISGIMKTCPSLIALTTNPAAAEYFLNPQMKGSTLSNAQGDVLYVSPAIKTKNTVKDICNFIATHER